LKYADILSDKLKADIENLGKENIDTAIAKAVSI
jgi:hypothetical protein